MFNKRKIKIFWPKTKLDETKFNSNFYKVFFADKERYLNFAPAIPILISLTPSDFKITYHDENEKEINFDEKIDLAAISAVTAVADRAYEIADEFRKRKVPVIMGGIHVSSLPDEALEHADSVVIGEVEDLWRQIIKDFRKKGLKKIYKSERPCNFDNLPIPKYWNVNFDNYMMRSWQTTRGCPYNCEFCTVSKFFGTKIRCKPINSVMKEFKNLYSSTPMNHNGLMITDDHFTGPREHAKELLVQMYKLQSKIEKQKRSPLYFLKIALIEKLKIRLKTPLYMPEYVIQARLDLYKDDEMLDLLVKTGCIAAIIGFESISQKSLNKMNKKNNVENYITSIEKIQSKGIAVYGSFIFGNDDEDISVFDKTVKFINESKMALPLVNIVTPYPGTALYYRLKEEGRLLNKEYRYYNSNYVCFTPKHMSADELQDGFLWASQKIYELNIIYSRLRHVFNKWNEDMLGRRIRLHIFSRNLELNWFAYSIPQISDRKFV